MLKREKMMYLANNGYTGILVTGSSLIVKDKNKNIVLHIESPECKTREDLKQLVDTLPEFREMLEAHR